MIFMKYLNYLFIGLLCFSLLIASCTKDEPLTDDFSNLAPIIQIPNANWPQKDVFPFPPVDSLLGTTQLNLYAKISFRKALSSDIIVEFAKDDDAAIMYNLSRFGIYELLPETHYAVSSLKLTIPAGTLQASVPITLFPDKIRGVQNFIIAFSIKNAGGLPVASNYKTMIFTLLGQ
jgi:hypothetical protein